MSDPLEKKYAVAYWDQRLSGNSKGSFDSEIITPSLMIEDTDKVIDLLKHHYGQDISVFLLGHSWGGYLGNAYLAQSEANQAKVKGWIDVAGAHNIEKVIRDGLLLMGEVASTQIAANSKMADEWETVQSFVEEVNPIEKIDIELISKVNPKGHSASFIAIEDNLVKMDQITISELASLFFKDNHLLANMVNTKQMSQTKIWDILIDTPLTDELSKIKTPTLLIFGKYDFVVPPSLGEEALQNLGTGMADKSLHIFEHSGHSPTHSEPEKFVDLVIDFVDTYK